MVIATELAIPKSPAVGPTESRVGPVKPRISTGLPTSLDLGGGFPPVTSTGSLESPFSGPTLPDLGVRPDYSLTTTNPIGVKEGETVSSTPTIVFTAETAAATKTVFKNEPEEDKDDGEQLVDDQNKLVVIDEGELGRVQGGNNDDPYRIIIVEGK